MLFIKAGKFSAMICTFFNKEIIEKRYVPDQTVHIDSHLALQFQLVKGRNTPLIVRTS